MFQSHKSKKRALTEENYFSYKGKEAFFQNTFVAPFLLVKGGWRRMKRLVKSQRNSHSKTEVADEKRVAGTDDKLVFRGVFGNSLHHSNHILISVPFLWTLNCSAFTVLYNYM